MKTKIFETGIEAACYAADAVARVLAEKPNGVFCFATGSSSLPFFDAIVAKNLDFSQARFVGLDDWMENPQIGQGKCDIFLREHFSSRINVREENMCLFDPREADGNAECRRVTNQIAAWDGIDYLLLGLGVNGHIGFNEPGCDLNGTAHVTSLPKITLEGAAKFFGKPMPPETKGITLGLADIKAARLIHLLVFGDHKREICTRLRSCEKPTPDLPASALLGLDHAELVLDQAATKKK